MNTNSIFQKLKELDYIKVGSPIREWNFLIRKIVGWNISSSSILRKSCSIRKIERDIEILELPLVVVDDNEFTNTFKVFIL